MSLEDIRLDVIAKLIDRHGQAKVDEVNNLDPSVVYDVSCGVDIPSVTDEQREIIYDFSELLINHPQLNCAKPYTRPSKRTLH